MKFSIIEEMLYGKLQEQWRRPDSARVSEKVGKEYKKAFDAIDEILMPEHRKEWDDYFLSECGVRRDLDIYNFRLGARFGLLLALELLQTEDPKED